MTHREIGSESSVIGAQLYTLWDSLKLNQEEY